jgi:hypothetical protein
MYVSLREARAKPGTRDRDRRSFLASRGAGTPHCNTVSAKRSIFPFLRLLLPAGAFEGGLRSGFNLDKPAS